MSFTVKNHTSSGPQTMQLTTQTPGTVNVNLRADANWIQLSSIKSTL